LAQAAATGAPWGLRVAGEPGGEDRRGYETLTRIVHPRSEGDLGPGPAGDLARAALVEALLTLVGRDGSADFYYGVAAGIAGHPSTIFRAPLTDLAALRRSFVDPSDNPVAGPELWWPQDRSWLVNTDYGCTFTDVFGNRALADLVTTSADLETVPVVRPT
jgi:hypothetical protein